MNNVAISNLIRDDRAFQIPGIMQTGKKVGMIVMDESLMDMARAGTISADDAATRASNPKRVASELGVAYKG